MTIKKFQGRTEEEAIERARAQLGTDVVIMNIKEIRPKGILSFLKEAEYEVTAAVEEKEQIVKPANFSIHENINFTADEPIEIPVPKKAEEKVTNHQADVLKEESRIRREREEERQSYYAAREGLEERIENLQNFLEKQLAPANNKEQQSPKVQEKENELSKEQAEGFKFLKMIYGILLENEVDEKYANMILEDIEKVVRTGSSVDYILSTIYQKMILKFGQPRPIELSNKKPKVVFFIGPTGVGKTTTIAKVASKFKVDEGKSVAFLTADTYRIAAAEQLRTYANILDNPFSIVYTPEEVNDAIAKVSDCDLVLIDTAGFSHKNSEQGDDIKRLIDSVDKKYEKEVFLVVSATTKYKDLLSIADVYRGIADYRLIFTKLDETSAYGNLLNLRLYSGAELSYTTNGQNVPNDIELFNTQKIVKQLLGGK
ncbi:MAG: flagellar biosynthesis protein FlhF [Lachnospiraceae bacterium]|uniref:flagellar biosynthesis protein FlhF n=1 Tax=Roseburia hominis TaxID=301301 RepID=UPI001EFF6A19|nr:flagellar biosynthesis protein FlhF [Roseburia hominis]MCI5713431.1 flagellar biosynthesis protein FlhF [Lachnospiraceae bacterium]MDD6169993.1 flagellar biosynthesis protein FlhF [Lachnospiraceae bacterium]MDY4840366.1 flagellar biosynthesis protein FlhF [Lachnospiraceae bacterium]